MASDSEDSDCGPGLASSQYERGPTNKNPAMFPMERAICDAIEARCGKAGSPQPSSADMSDSKPSCPGAN